MSKKRVEQFIAPDNSVGVKVYYDSDWREYTVRLYLDGKLHPSADYFTPDKQDANATAKHMYDHNIHSIKFPSTNKKGTHMKNPLPSYEKLEMSDAAYELALFISNDGNLYKRQTLPIIDNLKKKVNKGTFDLAKSVTLWKYLADNGAKEYTFEYGDRGNARYSHEIKGFGSFSVADRKQVAQWLADYYLEHIMEDSRASNPAPRIGTAKPKRRSQVTGKAPSKRLVARRAKNKRRGYFPNPADIHVDINSHNDTRKNNPIADKIALKFNAGNDRNGNPRRVFVVVNTSGVVLSAHDEGYQGEKAVTQHYPGIAIVGQFDITPTDYKYFIKQYPYK
jgi:hypothetical protein